MGDGELLGDVERAIGVKAVSARPLGGGCVADVRLVVLADGTSVVVKRDGSGGGGLEIEGWMLDFLRERSGLPVPRTLSASARMLVMEHLPGRTGAMGEAAQRHGAALLADLHGISADKFGLERDTLIGGLAQPNGWMSSWVDFFRERRLLFMAEEAAREGALPAGVHRRIETLAARLADLIDEPAAPSLLHGDVWSGNVLASEDRITGFVDPAISFGHAEIELAFITLFSTFGPAFFRAYEARRPLAPGFFGTRRHVYNLYPLLVHVRLFRGGYVGEVESALGGLGF